MKNRTRTEANQRVDNPDFEALHGLVDEALRDYGVEVFGGPALIRGGVATVNPENDSQVLVTPPIGIVPEMVDGSAKQGMLCAPVTSDDAIVEFAGQANGTYGVYIRFVYENGSTANRAFWAPSDEEEEVRLINTRRVAGFSAALFAADPGENWLKVADAVWDGSFADADVTDARDLFFEGALDADEAWALPAFSRDSDRSANGQRTIRGMLLALAKRIEELSGRAWYDALKLGESVRSASAEITVTVTGTYDRSAHKALSSDAATRRTELALLITAPDMAGEDPRAGIRLIRGLVVDLDVTAASLNPFGTTRRVISGPATIRRSAGENPLFDDGASGLIATFDEITFDATDGTDELVVIDHASSRIAFRNCTFGRTSGLGAITRLVNIDAAAEVTFIDCRFLATDDGTVAVRIGEDDADVRFVRCHFEGPGGGTGDAILAVGEPHRLSIARCHFEGWARAVDALDAVVNADGCTFASIDEDTAIWSGSNSKLRASAADAEKGAVRAGGGIFNSLKSWAGDLAHGAGASALSILDNNGALSTLRASIVRAAGSIVAFADSDTGHRIERSSDRFAFLTGASTTDPAGAVVHAEKLQLGLSTDALALFDRDALPRAWIRIKVTSGDPSASIDYEGGGPALDDLAVTFDLADSDHHFIHVGDGSFVDGFDPRTAAIIATVSTEGSGLETSVNADLGDHVGRMSVGVYGVSATGFYLAPKTVRRKQTISLSGNAEDIDVITENGFKGHDFSDASEGIPPSYAINIVIFASI